MLKYILGVVDSFFDTLKRAAALTMLHLNRSLRKLNGQELVYFTKADDISVLNKVMIYVQENEITKKLKIVTILGEEDKVASDFFNDLNVLDRAYPDIKIEYLRLHGTFGPEIIVKLSHEWDIPINFMFIISPSDKFSHRVSDLGGVRLII